MTFLIEDKISLQNCLDIYRRDLYMMKLQKKAAKHRALENFNLVTHWQMMTSRSWLPDEE